MGKHQKLLAQILGGYADANIAFNDLRSLLSYLGFNEPIRGSHHIFSKNGMEEILNIQPKGRNAKRYQVKQIREIIVKYQMAGKLDEE